MVILAASKTTIDVSSDVITASIIASTNAIHHSCLVTTDMITKWYSSGGLPTIEINTHPVLITFGAIHAAQMSLMTLGHMSPRLSAENTRSIVQNTLDKLWRSVPDTVQAIMSRHADLVAAGLGRVVQNSLELLLHNHEIAGHAIAAKFDQRDTVLMEGMQRQGKEVTGKILEGIEVFRGEEVV